MRRPKKSGRRREIIENKLECKLTTRMDFENGLVRERNDFIFLRIKLLVKIAQDKIRERLTYA